MSRYFEFFPTITYDGVAITDITKRANFIETNLSNPFVFLPYTIAENERPEEIAYHYYGSVNYTWAVLLGNQIIDPYYQWPIPSNVFEQYLIDKYAAETGLIGENVLRWAYNQTIFSNIVYYYKLVDDRVVKINKDSLNVDYLLTQNNEFILTEDDERLFSSATPPEGYMPYRVGEYEEALNEQRRNIVVIEKSYITKAEKDLRRLMAI